MIKARASGSKVYLYFMRKGRQARHRIPRNSCVYIRFSTLYTTLPHNLIKDKQVGLIERIVQREGSLYIACNDGNAFFTSDVVRYYNLWSCQKVCEALTFLVDGVCISFGSRLYR